MAEGTYESSKKLLDKMILYHFIAYKSFSAFMHFIHIQWLTKETLFSLLISSVIITITCVHCLKYSRMLDI